MNPIEEIIRFNENRNLTDFSPVTEHNSLQEELQEFFVAYSENNENEMVNALCDITVFAVGALHKMGYKPDLAILETTKEIHSRRGEINEATGKWEKDRDQDPATLYSPDYSLARR